MPQCRSSAIWCRGRFLTSFLLAPISHNNSLTLAQSPGRGGAPRLMSEGIWWLLASLCADSAGSAGRPRLQSSEMPISKYDETECDAAKDVRWAVCLAAGYCKQKCTNGGARRLMLIRRSCHRLCFPPSRDVLRQLGPDGMSCRFGF